MLVKGIEFEMSVPTLEKKSLKALAISVGLLVGTPFIFIHEGSMRGTAISSWVIVRSP
jgi:hypothetical protein